MEFNDGHIHEALDRVYILMETLGNYVSDHPCAQRFPDIAAQCEVAHTALFDLYQLIGAKE